VKAWEKWLESWEWKGLGLAMIFYTPQAEVYIKAAREMRKARHQ
jgi:hypothetical protein